MEKDVNFSVDEIKRIDFSEYDEAEYMCAKMGYISTRPNSHEIVISEDVLRESAPSVLGKWVVAKTKFGDAGTHEDDEIIVGLVPKDQDVEFIKDDDGYLRAYVDCILSKRYAKDFCDIFSEDDSTRAVSVEAKFTMDGDDATSFNICGVTCLGHRYNPSVPESEIAIVRFSEEDAETYYEKMHEDKLAEQQQFVIESEGKEEKMAMEIEFAAVNIGDLWSTLYNAMRDNRHWDYYIQGIYEEDNQKFAVVYDDTKKLYRLDFSLTEDGITLADEITEVLQEFVPTDNVQRFAEPENVADYRLSEPDDGDDETDTDEEEHEHEMSADEMKAEIDRLAAEVEEKQNIIMDKDSSIEAMTVELEELRAYKEAILAKERAVCVEAIMADVKNFVDDEQYKSFREEGLACKDDELEAWTNKVKATCFSEVKKNIKKDDTGVFSFAAPDNHKTTKSASIWERLKNQ